MRLAFGLLSSLLLGSTIEAQTRAGNGWVAPTILYLSNGATFTISAVNVRDGTVHDFTGRADVGDEHVVLAFSCADSSVTYSHKSGAPPTADKLDMHLYGGLVGILKTVCAQKIYPSREDACAAAGTPTVECHRQEPQQVSATANCDQRILQADAGKQQALLAHDAKMTQHYQDLIDKLRAQEAKTNNCLGVNPN
jgi:hypothetical protein